MTDKTRLVIQLITVIFQFIALIFLVLSLRSMRRTDKIIEDNKKRLEELFRKYK